MQLLKILKSAAVAAVFAGGALFSAVNANATPLAIGSGWTYDQINTAGAPSINSDWTFTLTGDAVFSITDAFLFGDHYTVSGSFGLGTALGLLPTDWTPGTDSPDLAWANVGYQHGQITLAPGSYTISITGDGGGGLPAGFYVRLDVQPVPEPATLALLGLGLAGLGFSRRRKR